MSKTCEDIPKLFADAKYMNFKSMVEEAEEVTYRTYSRAILRHTLAGNYNRADGIMQDIRDLSDEIMQALSDCKRRDIRPPEE